MKRYLDNALACSKITLKNYSHSFSIGIRFLKSEYRDALCALYGFLRLAGEIKNSTDKEGNLNCLMRLKDDTTLAIEKAYSTNPILHSFQYIVNKYQIGLHLIDAFFYSIELDLKKKKFSPYEFDLYVYGSAEVIGLMCLHIFYGLDKAKVATLSYPARKLGQAFRHVILLRDIQLNYSKYEKVYFPNLDINEFTAERILAIDQSIQADFAEAFNGILLLKKEVRLAVLLSYAYYVAMLKKMRKCSPKEIINSDLHLSFFSKLILLSKSLYVETFPYYKKPKSYNLKVDIDSNSGFCFGVVNAVKQAEQALSDGEKLYCVGEIMHNEEEIHRLESKGMVTIDKTDLEDLEPKTILFRAHGEPPSSFDLAKRKKHNVIDASCPIVIGVQKKIKLAHSRGENVVIFGKPKHAEVIGLNGQINNEAIVVPSLEVAKETEFPQSLTLFSQTTMDPVKYDALKLHLEERGIAVKERNTICKSVMNRKESLIDFCEKYDIILFVAGENSSNGKVLFSTCAAHNNRSYFISSPNKIYRKWFKDGDTVGVCGATSTPKWLMEEAKSIVEAY